MGAEIVPADRQPEMASLSVRSCLVDRADDPCLFAVAIEFEDACGVAFADQGCCAREGDRPGELEVLSVGLVVGLCLGRSRAGGRASRCRCSRRSGRCGPGRGLVAGPGMA